MITLYQSFPTLSTERLTLRQLTLEDAPEIFIQRSDPRMLEFIEIQVSKTVEDAAAFIQKINAGIPMGSTHYWAISRKDNPTLIGTICLWNLSVETATAEIGYALNPDAQGHGYMDEAFKRVIIYGFESMKAKVIEAFSHPQNMRSIRLLEKNGFEQIGKKDGCLVFAQNENQFLHPI